MFRKIDLNSFDYPVLLRQIKDPPESLYIKGDLPNSDAPMVAIVGSRECTPYGRRVTRQITEPLARAGIVIVSGLAFGIDAVAHEAAVDAGGKTVAVLASDINHTTPAGNRPLAERILDHGGAIISESGTPTDIHKSSFPIRNRIISGLCLATVVIEAANGSGSLVTAHSTLDQNRELFAVPGPIDSKTSEGTNTLLKSQAHLVTSATDILDVLGMRGLKIENVSFAPPTPETKEEALILPLLSKQPKQIDEIIRETGLPTATVGSAMTMMEIKGKVRHVGGRHYIVV